MAMFPLSLLNSRAFLEILASLAFIFAPFFLCIRRIVISYFLLEDFTIDFLLFSLYSLLEYFFLCILLFPVHTLPFTLHSIVISWNALL